MGIDVGSDDEGIGAKYFIVAGVWAIAICVGMGILVDYESTPGGAETTPDHWPQSSRIPRDSHGYQLIMFAHPKCPCTRASIGELASIMARTQDQLSAQVLFLLPESVEEHWAMTDLWTKAARIPGVTLLIDEGGAEARIFGAVTSGHSVLYDPGGRLLFSGGVTASRGHSGDNLGRSTIIALANDVSPRNPNEAVLCAVFGCGLFAEPIE